MVRSIFLAAALLAAACMRANADVSNEDIASYNAALQEGEVVALKAAASRLAAASIANPDHPDAALLAFEAAWTLCRIGDCAAAQPAAVFAASFPGAPETAPLLEAYVTWKVDPTRRALNGLDAELKKIEHGPPTGLSVSAFRDIYTSTAKSPQGWTSLARVSARAADHFAQGGDPVPQYRTEARLLALSAAFNHTPDISQMRDMVHLRGELARMRALFDRERPDEDYPGWMEDTYWIANAWEGAMSAFLMSSSKKYVSDEDIEKIVDTYLADLPPEEEERGEERPDFCKGSFIQKPPIKYPTSAAFRGRIGSVILGFRFENGRVKDAEVLASVPLDGFREEAVKAVSQWHFEPSEDPAVTGCRLDDDNVIQPLVFAIH